MQYLHVFLCAVGSFIALFLLTKLIGNRQVSQLNMFDYINGITIGSIAAEMATSLEDDFLLPLLAMVIYASLTFIISIMTSKSLKIRRFFSGKPMVLLQNGQLYYKNFSKSKLDLSEFLTECRENGYFNIAELQTAVMEPNGKISFMPRAMCRPTTARDLNVKLDEEKPVISVIMDGKVIDENLHYTGNNMIWLEKQLKQSGFDRPEQVFLATCDSSNNLSVYGK